MTKEKIENKVTDKATKGQNYDLKSDELGKILHTKQEILDSIKIVSDDKLQSFFNKEILPKISNFSSDISCLYDSTFVSAEHPLNGSYNYSDFKGLQYAQNLYLDNPEKVIVITSILNKDHFLKAAPSKYLRLLGKKNVFFADMLSIDELEGEIQEYNKGPQKDKTVNDEPEFHEMLVSNISKFLHDLGHDEKFRKMTKGLNNQEKLKYVFMHESELNQELKDFVEEMIKLLEIQHPSFKFNSRDEKKQGIIDIYDYEMSREVPEGTYYEGVYVDRDGCLYDNYNLKINDNILDLIKDYEKQGMKVHIWTGGNLEKKQKILDATGMPYTIESKTAYKGATVEVLVDNDTADIVYANTKIKSKTHVTV